MSEVEVPALAVGALVALHHVSVAAVRAPHAVLARLAPLAGALAVLLTSFMVPLLTLSLGHGWSVSGPACIWGYVLASM